MGSRRTPRQWIRTVLSSNTVTDTDKVAAVEYFFEMRDNLQVSTPREVIAKRLGRSERAVDRRVASLHAAGFFDTIVRGRKGVTAVYVGMFPSPASNSSEELDAQRDTRCRPEEEAQRDSFQRAESVPKCRPEIGQIGLQGDTRCRTSTTANPSSRTPGRNVSTDGDAPAVDPFAPDVPSPDWRTA